MTMMNDYVRFRQIKDSSVGSVLQNLERKLKPLKFAKVSFYVRIPYELTTIFLV